jgi:hypothetical protein
MDVTPARRRREQNSHVGTPGETVDPGIARIGDVRCTDVGVAGSRDLSDRGEARRQRDG